MSWSLNLSGHAVTEEEEAAELEEMRKLVTALDTVSYANFAGQWAGSVDLLAPNNEGGE